MRRYPRGGPFTPGGRAAELVGKLAAHPNLVEMSTHTGPVGECRESAPTCAMRENRTSGSLLLARTMGHLTGAVVADPDCCFDSTTRRSDSLPLGFSVGDEGADVGPCSQCTFAFLPRCSALVGRFLTSLVRTSEPWALRLGRCGKAARRHAGRPTTLRRRVGQAARDGGDGDTVDVPVPSRRMFR